MKMPHVVMVLVAILCAASASAASVDTVVASFYPAKLLELAQGEERVPQRYQAFEETSFGDTGAAYIVAAYTNGADGAVRVLRRTSSGWVLASEPSFDGFSGKFPDLSLADVDHDGVPEIIASFATEKGSENWIFQWKSEQLVLVSPSTQRGGTRYTGFTGVELLDTSGDGVLDVIDHKFTQAGDELEPRDTLYHWSNGAFAEVGPLTWYSLFNRGLKGEPKMQEESFSVDAPAAAYEMTVVNGGLRGVSHRTSSASIELNGLVVVPPSEFSQQRAAFRVGVTLQSENRINVRVAGDPGSQIAVLIRPVD